MIFLFFKPYVALLEAELALFKDWEEIGIIIVIIMTPDSSVMMTVIVLVMVKISHNGSTFLRRIFSSFGAERRPLQILIGMIER